MHINELRDLLKAMQDQGITECRCLDDMTGTSKQLCVEKVLVDSQGQIVNSARLECVEFEPFNPKDFIEAYEEFKGNYQSFDEFFQEMEDARLKEVELINNAQPVILIRSI